MQVMPAERIGLNIYSPDMVMRRKPSDASKASQQAAAAEQRVLAQERALKASVPGGTTQTTYTYATGPDGRMYITGADVKIVAPEDEILAATGRGGTPAGSRTRAADLSELRASRANGGLEEDPRVRAQIAKLEQTQREVIAHEAAHMAAGGQLAGGASYTYTTGPDGKRYITGGSVPISMPASSDPEEALANALQILRAATAPAGPSGPDMAVAASAAQMAAQARIDMASEQGGVQTVGGDDAEGFDPYRGGQAKSAYGATSSPFGMWTKSNGFEPDTAAQKEEADQFAIAA